MFLLQNLVLVAMVFVIFWITLFPLISKALTGTKVSVGPPAFTPVRRAAGDRPGPAHGRRADDLLAAGDRRQPAPNFTYPVCFGVLVTIAGAGPYRGGQQAR